MVTLMDMELRHLQLIVRREDQHKPFTNNTNTLLPITSTRFTFYSGSTADQHTSDDIFVLNFSRTRIREELDTDSFEIHLSGSNGIFKFIDDSADITNPTITPGGSVYNIASGSIDLTTTGSDIVTYTASNGEGYGKFYPESGLIIFNPSAIGDTVGTIGSVEITGSTEIHRRVFTKSTL